MYTAYFIMCAVHIILWNMMRSTRHLPCQPTPQTVHKKLILMNDVQEGSAKVTCALHSFCFKSDSACVSVCARKPSKLIRVPFKRCVCMYTRYI